MSRISLEDAEKRLQTVNCAVCKTNTFAIDRRFVQADGECRGICLKCRYNFPIYTDMDFYRRTQPDIPYRLREIPCPTCKQRWGRAGLSHHNVGPGSDLLCDMQVMPSPVSRTIFFRSLRIAPLFVRTVVYTLAMSDKPKQPEPESSSPEPAPKVRKEIPLISVPNDRDMIAEEMEELFDEDRVSHQHGSSEPEAD